MFTARDQWKSLVLYGLNTATYKIAFGKTPLDFAQNGQSQVLWEQLSKAFLDHYIARLSIELPMPQLSHPIRRTVMEKVVAKLKAGTIDYDTAFA